MKNLFLLALTLTILGCSKDTETTLQPYYKIIFVENFNTANDETVLDVAGWTNFAETGTKVWKEQVYNNNGYAEFSAFERNATLREPSNNAWLISPKINMDLNEGEVLTFQCAQAFLTSQENSFEVLVSTNFDGVNITNSEWINISARLPNFQDPTYEFISSGKIDLSKYKGMLNIAFRYKGSSFNQNIDGTYQVDNISVQYEVKQ